MSSQVSSGVPAQLTAQLARAADVWFYLAEATASSEASVVQGMLNATEAAD